MANAISHDQNFKNLILEMPAEDWRDSGNLVARVNLPNMNSPPHRRVAVHAAAVSGLLALEPDPDKRAKARPAGATWRSSTCTPR